MKVRSLTFLVPASFLRDFSQITPFIHDVINEVSKKYNLDVWSLRLAINPQNLRNLISFIDFLDGVSEHFDYYAVPVVYNSSFDIDLIISLLKDYDKMFFSMFGGYSSFKAFRDLLVSVGNKLSLDCFIRLSFSVDNPIITPYFPSASAGKDIMLTASFLYVNDLLEAVKRSRSISETIFRCFKRVEEFVIEIANYLKINSIVFDLSISPWMEESVVDLIEVYGGIKFNDIGTLNSIYQINKSIMEVTSKGEFFIGFNELMLPYAEDLRLMLLGSKGVISAYDLLHLSSVCVAGFDMAVLPKINMDLLDLFLLDVYSLLKAKSKPCGFRIVLSDREYGDNIDLGFLGRVPIMKLH
ncbi:MAG: DUF711 family protein [Candidatus Methanomethylicia archaeon]|nr:DUF711 family protein [Candidatus Methanomethylicia archaeon]